MRKFTRLVFLLLLLISVNNLKAQQPDITGIWNGYLELNDTLGNPVRLPFEIAVSEEKGKLVGYSRIIFHANGKDEAGMQGITMKWKGNTLVIEDEGFVEHEFSVNPSSRVRKTMIMTLSETETERTLEGTWSTNRTRAYPVATKGTSILKRKVDFKASALYKRLDTLKIAEKLSFSKQEIPTVAQVTPVVEKPVTPPPPPPAPEPTPDPELIIPALDQQPVFTKLPVTKKAQQSTAKVSPPAKPKKQQMDYLARNFAKPKPIAPPPPKPTPEVAVVKPKPEPVEKPAPVAEKKPDVAIVKPKAPPPPPIVIVAPSVVQGAAEVSKRTTKSDKEVYFESDSLTLTLYDNGDVDGDTVTVLMNGNIVFSKQGLSTKANTKTVYTNNISGDSVSLVMYAETLGEIPPNTGLLIIMDGEKRYEVRFSADLKTNAAIILRRKKGNQ